MINKEQLLRYKKFDGDLDKWVGSQKRDRDELLTGADWTLIDKVVQRLKIEKNQYASNDFREETKRVLARTFENEEVIKLAKDMIP
jgi:hypothetical protein